MLINYNILRAPENVEYEVISNFETSEKEIDFIDDINFLSGPWMYKMEVINYCDNIISESDNQASTIILERKGEPTTPTLQWNNYTTWVNGIDEYIVYRKFENDDFAPLTTGI